MANFLGLLPGWEMVIFSVLVLIFLLVGGVVTFIILSRVRWPFGYVILENISGQGYVVSRRGRCRIVSFGDGGEEVFLLKHLNKYRIGYGKRIGHKQVAWVVGEDGLWYQINFGNLDKALRELGLVPTSVNVRLGMASVRKGLDKRLEPGEWMTKYGAIIGMGILFLMVCVMAFSIYHTQNKLVEVAAISSDSINVSIASQEATQKTLARISELIEKIDITAYNPNINVSIGGGSGLSPAT